MGKPTDKNGIKATVRENGIFIERPKGYTNEAWARMAEIMLEALNEGARLLAFKTAMMRTLLEADTKAKEEPPKDEGMVN
jgi:hypothetical protein